MDRLLSNRLVQVVVLLGLLAGLVALRISDPGIIHQLRQITFDTYNRLMPRAGGTGAIIVDIDEDSLRAYGQWPWPRTLVAKIPEVLKEMGARAVAFDIVFSEADRTSPALLAKTLPQTQDMAQVARKLETLPDNDTLFAQKIAALGNVVTGFVAASGGQKTNGTPALKANFLSVGIAPAPEKFVTAMPYYTTSLAAISGSAAGDGSFVMTPGQDGIVRQVPLLVGQQMPDGGMRLYPSLSLEALRVAEGKGVYKITSFGKRVAQGFGIQSVTLGDHVIPTDENGRFQVYYAGHRKHGKDLYVPARDVLAHDPGAAAKIKGNIVFIGTSAIGLLDLRSSPLDPVLPGVEVHAEIVEQILGGQYLRRPGFFNGAELVATVGISLCIIFLAPFIGTGTLALLGTLLIGTGTAGALFAYRDFGLLLDPVYPALAILTIFILSSILTNLRSEAERRAIRAAFSHYISPALLEELTRDPDKLKLGGEVRELSVMFTDIRNFTSISETMEPAELIKMMNDFLTPMTSCVLNTRGTIDKYMGDAMMAFWNAPLDDDGHAIHACEAALAMQAALREVNAVLKTQAEAAGRKFLELKAGIGIHTGRASVGNMGSKQRFAYSALGDTVNLASRLEGQTKGYGITAMISAETYRQAPQFAAIEIDLLTVKGRSEPERVFTLLGNPEYAETDDFKALSAAHQGFLTAYRAQNWDEAEALSQKAEALKPELAGLYALYRQRMADYKKNPPPAGWRGVWVAQDKH